MEKRKQLVENEKAVSAVIAVMLMVAMAVAMAAVAYAYLTGMIGGENLEEPPIIDFNPNNDANTLTFTYMDRPVDWEDLQLIITDGTTTATMGSGHSGEISVGQKISINVNDQGLTDTVTITITHLPSATMVGEYTFEDVV